MLCGLTGCTLRVRGVAMPVTITTAIPPETRANRSPVKKNGKPFSKIINAGAHLPLHRSALPPPAAAALSNASSRYSSSLLKIKKIKTKNQRATNQRRKAQSSQELPKPHASSSPPSPAALLLLRCAVCSAVRGSRRRHARGTPFALAGEWVELPRSWLQSLNCAGPGALTATRPVPRLQICGGTHGVDQIGPRLPTLVLNSS
jgi:hypothetical protein